MVISHSQKFDKQEFSIVTYNSIGSVSSLKEKIALENIEI